jgi:hypothetical protein
MHDRLGAESLDEGGSDDISNSFAFRIGDKTLVVLSILILASVLHFVSSLGFVTWHLVSHATNATSPTKSPIELAFPSCGKPCIITFSKGGKLDDFAKAAISLKEDDMVVIDGVCISACALFADVARPQVCVTPKAVFVFHAGYDHGLTRRDGSPLRIDPPHSLDIRRYVYELGGFTESEEWSELPALAYPDTLDFWPLCKKDSG